MTIHTLPRRSLFRIGAVAGILAIAGSFASPVFAQDKPVQLFKIVSVKDDVTIGLNADELKANGGDAGGLARTLKEKGTLSVWQYATRKAANGDLEQAPLRKIGVLAHDSLRVEPYSSPLKVLPHE